MSSLNIEKLAQIFLHFVQEVKSKICGISEDWQWKGMAIRSEFDPEDSDHHNQLILKCWDSMASNWIAVESKASYQSTMISILERIFTYPKPTNTKLKILSLGSGPGTYEIFLAKVLKDLGFSFSINTTDYSAGMINFQKRVLSSDLRIGKTKVSSLKLFVSPSVADMTNLPEYFDKRFDLVICNNSLQWVDDWCEAIKQISESLNPSSLIKSVLFFIHPHAMQLKAGDVVISRDKIELSDLLDNLNQKNLSPVKTRLLAGPPNSGQVKGAALNRMMLEAVLHPKGVPASWRDLQPTRGAIKTIAI